MHSNLETSTDGQIVKSTVGFEPPVKTFDSLTSAVDSVPFFSPGSLGYRLLIGGVGIKNGLCSVSSVIRCRPFR